MKMLNKHIHHDLVLNRTGTGLVTGSFKYTRWFLIVCLIVFWANPSLAEIYVYEKNGSYLITDSYKGSNYVKRYKTKRTKPKTSSRIRNKTNGSSANGFSDEIFEASKKYDVNSNFIKAVIATESNFRPDAVSPKGAMGLMQLMPKTASRLKVTDPFDPYQNIDGGTRYLKHLLKQFKGNRPLALAAYNAGEQEVKKYGTIPPFKETTSYVRKVLNYFKSYEGKRKSRKKSLIYKNISPNGTIMFSDNVQIKFTQ